MVIIRGVITCEPGRNNNTLVERLRALDQSRFPQHRLHRSVAGGSIKGEENLFARYCKGWWLVDLVWHNKTSGPMWTSPGAMFVELVMLVILNCHYDDDDDDSKSDGLWIGHYAKLPRPAFALYSLIYNQSSSSSSDPRSDSEKFSAKFIHGDLVLMSRSVDQRSKWWRDETLIRIQISNFHQSWDINRRLLRARRREGRHLYLGIISKSAPISLKKVGKVWSIHH